MRAVGKPKQHWKLVSPCTVLYYDETMLNYFCGDPLERYILQPNELFLPETTKP